ncbi:MAG: hypothetical protein MJZ83_04230 [Bacteroidaceae bacterium]|nr:hypothetical protein [Bacteroidaceae bacterium]
MDIEMGDYKFDKGALVAGANINMNPESFLSNFRGSLLFSQDRGIILSDLIF